MWGKPGAPGYRLVVPVRRRPERTASERNRRDYAAADGDAIGRSARANNTTVLFIIRFQDTFRSPAHVVVFFLLLYADAARLFVCFRCRVCLSDKRFRTYNMI